MGVVYQGSCPQGSCPLWELSSWGVVLWGSCQVGVVCRGTPSQILHVKKVVLHKPLISSNPKGKSQKGSSQGTLAVQKM